MNKRGPKTPMSDQHKEALALGRTEGRAVRNYLEALREHKPKRGRKRTPTSIQTRLDAIEGLLETADPLSELRLIQEKSDLTAELLTMGEGFDMAEVEDEFVKVAASYSRRSGISYNSWRTVGVSASVLKRAGISRAG